MNEILIACDFIVFRESFQSSFSKYPNFGSNSCGWYRWWTHVVSETIKNSQDKDVTTPSILSKISTELIEFYSSSDAYYVEPEFLPLLKYLNGRKIIIGAISNTDQRLKRILSKLRILDYFEFVVTSYGAGFVKPDSRIFDYALNQLNSSVLPSSTVHIGDSVLNDYVGAKNAGWNSILVNPKFELACHKESIKIDFDSMVKSLKDVTDILTKFN